MELQWKATVITAASTTVSNNNKVLLLVENAKIIVGYIASKYNKN